MLTWTLWRELQHPPRSHPLFWRVIQQGQISGRQWWVRLFQIVAVLGLVGVAFVSLPSALTLLVCGVFTVPVMILIGSSGFYASLSAMDTADVLAREARDGTHDLLRVTPAGAPAVDWLVASACLNRNQRLSQAHQLVRVVAVGGGLALGAVTLFLMASVATAQEQERSTLTSIALTDISRLTALCLLLYLDHIHSFIAGGLVGIITAYTVHTPLEARVWAFIGFWTQQAAAYALTFGLTLLLWRLMEQLFEPTIGRILLMSASILLSYAVVREGMLTGLWRWMLHLSLGSSRLLPMELSQTMKRND
jgi:hypothetical protein